MPEVKGTVTGTYQGLGTTAGSSTGSEQGKVEPPPCQHSRSPLQPRIHPGPAEERSFSSGQVFAQRLPAASPRWAHTSPGRRLRLLCAPMATCEGSHASFLPLLFLGSPGAGNEALGAAGVTGGGGQAGDTGEVLRLLPGAP